MKKKFVPGGRLRLLLRSGGASGSHFIIQGLKNLDLRFLAAINKILAEQVRGRSVNIRQASHEVDFSSSSYHSVRIRSMNSFTRAALAPGVVGLRNDEFGNRRDGCVLMGIERLQHGLLRKLFVHRLEHRKCLSGQ